MSRIFALFLLLSLLGAGSSSARAQASVAMLPPKIDPSVNTADATAILSEVAARLREQGFSVQEPASVKHKLPRALRDCADAECAAQALPGLDANLALLLSVFAPAPGGAPSVSLELVDRAGVSYAGSAEPSPGQSSALAALDDAITRQRRGPGPWLTVQGSPAGADILINGKPAGELPRFVGRVEPGMVHLIVREPGYKGRNELVSIGASLDSSQTVEVNLERESLPSLAVPMTSGALPNQAHSAHTTERTTGDRTEARDAASSWNCLLGGAGVAAGLLLWVKPIATLGQIGACQEQTASACRNKASWQSTSTLHAVLGTALTLGGAAVLVLRPLRVALDATPSQATLTVSGTL